MNKMFPKLFERGKIGTLELKNRIIKAPTLLGMANPDGSVTDRMVRYYEEVARGGSGLVMLEGARSIKRSDDYGFSVSGNQYIPGLSYLAQAIHDNGAKAAMQISGSMGTTKAPSRVPIERHGMPRIIPEELTVEEIRDLVASVGDAARRVRMAGFDLVNVHACHGDLANSFLSLARNKRNDLYGGSLENRMRYLLEVVRDVRKKVGPDFPFTVRLSVPDFESGGVVLEDALKIVKVLEQNGVDAIDISAGSHLSPAMEIYLAPCMLMPMGQNVKTAAAIKKVVKVPVVVAGAITTPEQAEEILSGGNADFLALGRTLFADPNWPKKAEEGKVEDIIPCIRCNVGCHDLGPPLFVMKCTTNPAMGWEDRAITPAERIKNVAVIGGGPAGMEAARVCALRGHKVTLYEKRKLGGALLSASSVLGRIGRATTSSAKSRSDISLLINYYLNQMKKLKVKVVPKEASVATIKDGKFDTVIVAVGAKLEKPDIPGINKPNVTDVNAVLSGQAKVGQRVHVVGGGVIGVQFGLVLSEQGKEVIFTTPQDSILHDIGQPKPVYEQILARQKKVTVYTNRWLDRINDKGAVVGDKEGNREEIPSDTVVLAMGFVPQMALRDRLEKETDLEVYAVGDCVSPRIIYDAIHDGFAVARMI